MTLTVASVRYRALLPAATLLGNGLSVSISGDADAINPAPGDVVIIVKSFSLGDMALAERCRAARALLVLDLCDNIFVGGYTVADSADPQSSFLRMADVADAICVPTDTLAEIVLSYCHGKPVYVIPDGIETESLLPVYRSLLPTPTLTKKISWKRRWRECHETSRERWARSACLYRRAWRGHRKNLLWFGNHGAAYGRFGIQDILLFKSALQRLNALLSVELTVISNHREKYQSVAAQLGVASRYVNWTDSAVHDWLLCADVVIIPNSLDEFSICKSSNRALLSLQARVPVVATATAALADLEGCLWTGDPYTGLCLYLTDDQEAKTAVEKAQVVIAEHFLPQAIGRLWLQAISKMQNAHASATDAPSPSAG